MKVSLAWLQEYLPGLQQSDSQIADALTSTGVEIENIVTRGSDFTKVIVAQIEGFVPHPNADRLSVCTVIDGSKQPRQIVCGAKNFQNRDKVPLALPGAVLPGGTRIKASKLRGVDSEGMLCSGKELGLAEDSAGLLILPPDSRVGAPLSEVFPSDTIFEMEITPDRPDLLSYVGLARELGILLGLDPHFPQMDAAAERLRRDEHKLAIAAPNGCPFIAFHRIDNVRVGPSPVWLKHRLESAGIRSINNIVDVTNYVMLELGKPLHSYDAATLEGGVVVRYGKSGEKLLALDGKTYSLSETDLVIADRKKAIGLAGVMGGEDTGVTTRTTSILLESANFAPALIRRMSRGLNLLSDASYRFERGIDPQSVVPALERAAGLIAEIADGAPAPEVLIAGEMPTDPAPIELRPSRVSALLGTEIPDLAHLLQRVGLRAAGHNTWQPPSYRLDLRREIDLIEEVSRYHGIGLLPSRAGSLATPATIEDRIHDSQMALRQRLAMLGLYEARNLTLIDGEDLTRTLRPQVSALQLRNPLAEEQRFLRPSLLPGLLRAAARNWNFGSETVALFELGNVFSDSGQRTALAIIVSGSKIAESWNQSVREYDFFDLKALVELVLARKLTYDREPADSFAVLRCRARAGEKAPALLGQLRPGLARDLGARGPVYVAEIDLEPEVESNRFVFRPLDRYPAVNRDIAFVADRELKFGAVVEALEAAAEPLLTDIRVFDVFVDPTGERIAADKKSIACSLTYRAPDRTLTQEEVNEVHQRLKSALVERLSVSLRE
ncbi:MAG: phenylalanine--tRNA ligase subunit beta [Verrucomicrobia bacterium]|nr:phenylalanine--tRNA ligase subunit beta [Verrucomicrobiota bacterium]